MQCRSNCGACCTAPSITTPIPGMPHGKPAGVPCVQLLDDFRCAIFNEPFRPKVCADFTAEKYVCGDSQEEAVRMLAQLEEDTQPAKTRPSIRKYS